MGCARKPLAFLLLLLFTLTASTAQAYSVLSHEETVDMAWSGHIVPLLRERYPNATADDLRIAHSYAYGGCIIQDLGYYPFGNKEFSDMLHYVRTGDFVNNLLKDATNLNEYAFALGALAHYRGDTIGHPYVGLATAREYPKLRTRFGPFVSYYDSPKAHIRTEFGFDVVQVAQRHYVKDDYINFIGFNVATPVLERAFEDTYGVEVKTVLKHEGLAINTYRYAVSTAIPEMTRAAVLHYGKQIQEQVPNFDRSRFVYRVDRADYEHEWGKQYHRPGIGAHLIAFIIKILPKRGPFSALKLELPNAADQKLYLDSMQTSIGRYEKDVDQLREQAAGGTLPLQDLDFDTGKPAALGEYPLADKSYAKLLDTVTHDKDAQVSSGLRANLFAYYANLHPRHRRRLVPAFFSDRETRKVERNLTLLRHEAVSASASAHSLSEPSTRETALPRSVFLLAGNSSSLSMR
ncbi:MAG: zinc dependent phospholipase C family protein [Acidobacteriaceae bacterium]